MSLRPPPGLHRRPVMLEPQCTHLNMTRLYDTHARCCMCHHPGRSGWVYQCTQDQENLIEHAVASTGLEVFDQLGQSFCARLTLQERSPAAREDRLSFFKEITPDQMSKYRPEHIATILKQRENVQTTIQKERLRNSGTANFGRLGHLNGIFDFSKPWIVGANEICQYMVCPSCRPSAADRAYLSLDAVAKGEILPTAAAGYGFHIQGKRPVVDAEILKGIGCRPIPLVRKQISSGNTSFESEASIVERLGNQIAREHDRWAAFPHPRDEDEQPSSQHQWPLTSTPRTGTGGHLKHSPKCENLAAYSEPREFLQKEQNGMPWTPPPSPGSRRRQSTSEIGPSPEQGSSRTSTPLIAGINQSQLLTNGCLSPHDAQTPRSSTPFHAPPNPPEPEFPLCLDDVAYQAACATPLGDPDFAEEHYFTGQLSPTGESTRPNGRFEPAPLKVGHGVAMMEESVELEIPDVITQA